MKIKTALLLLGLASVSLAANETTPREKRMVAHSLFFFTFYHYSLSGLISLFSIVQFPNDECTTTDVNVKTGVCTTSTECSDGGGTSSGNCASGFGGDISVLT